jgi:hypothetical protein
VILDSLRVPADAFATRTGWTSKPEGLCKGDACVPAPGAMAPDGTLDVTMVAERLRMPLVHDDDHGLWALGPESGGRALTSVEVPPLDLIDRTGAPFDFSSLRGRRVVMVAWASW